MVRMSGKFTPHALTPITTSFDPGSSEGTFSRTSEAGGPKALQRIALISVMFLSMEMVGIDGKYSG
jgi:hypothetical protein